MFTSGTLTLAKKPIVQQVIKSRLQVLHMLYLTDVHERDARASDESKQENLVKLEI